MPRWFWRLDSAICDRIGSSLPHRFTGSPLHRHANSVAVELDERSVTDRSSWMSVTAVSPFAKHLTHRHRTRLVAMDILESQLAKNVTADERIVADARFGLPFRDGCLDHAVSRSVLEQLADNAELLRECSTVPKPDGQTIPVFLRRASPTALLNRLPPHPVAKAFVGYRYPQREDKRGFRIRYMDCGYDGLARRLTIAAPIMEKSLVAVLSVNLLQGILANILCLAFVQFNMWRLNARRLAAQMLVVARKPTQ